MKTEAIITITMMLICRSSPFVVRSYRIRSDHIATSRPTLCSAKYRHFYGGLTGHIRIMVGGHMFGHDCTNCRVELDV